MHPQLHQRRALFNLQVQVFALSGHTNTVAAILSQPTDPQVMLSACLPPNALACQLGRRTGAKPDTLIPLLQVITGSHDTTIRLWDLRRGATQATLTYHKKVCRTRAPCSGGACACALLRRAACLRRINTLGLLANPHQSVRALAAHPGENTFVSAGADNIKKFKVRLCDRSGFVPPASTPGTGSFAQQPHFPPLQRGAYFSLHPKHPPNIFHNSCRTANFFTTRSASSGEACLARGAYARGNPAMTYAPLSSSAASFPNKCLPNQCLTTQLSAIVNTLAVNDDGVLVSGGDDGSLW
jgi:WD40 repeat protein